MKTMLLAMFLFPFGLAIIVKREPTRALDRRQRQSSCLPSPSSLVVCYGDRQFQAPITCTVVSNVTTLGPPQYFFDWDIAISTVVKGPATISIDDSVTIPDFWITLPENLPCYSADTYISSIGTALDLNFGQNPRVYNNGSTYSIAEGQYGVLIINAWTSQYQGSVQIGLDLGCPQDNWCWQDVPPLVNWEVNTRQIDASQGPGLFVGGRISFLTSDTWPIPCREGNCTHFYIPIGVA